MANKKYCHRTTGIPCTHECVGCKDFYADNPMRKLERHTHQANTVIWENGECIANFTGKNHIKDSQIFIGAVR